MTQSPKRQPAETAPTVDEVLREAFQRIESQETPSELRELIDKLTETPARTDGRN